jgi:hypothetical protein
MDHGIKSSRTIEVIQVQTCQDRDVKTPSMISLDYTFFFPDSPVCGTALLPPYRHRKDDAEHHQGNHAM